MFDWIEARISWRLNVFLHWQWMHPKPWRYRTNPVHLTHTSFNAIFVFVHQQLLVRRETHHWKKPYSPASEYGDQSYEHPSSAYKLTDDCRQMAWSLPNARSLSWFEGRVKVYFALVNNCRLLFFFKSQHCMHLTC